MRKLQHKKTDAQCVGFAEAEGFEPPVPCGTPVFKTGAIDQLCQTSGGAKIAHTTQTHTSSRIFSEFTDISILTLLNDNIHYGKLYSERERDNACPCSLDQLDAALIFAVNSNILSSSPVRA